MSKIEINIQWTMGKADGWSFSPVCRRATYRLYEKTGVHGALAMLSGQTELELAAIFLDIDDLEIEDLRQGKTITRKMTQESFENLINWTRFT